MMKLYEFKKSSSFEKKGVMFFFLWSVSVTHKWGKQTHAQANILHYYYIQFKVILRVALKDGNFLNNMYSNLYNLVLCTYDYQDEQLNTQDDLIHSVSCVYVIWILGRPGWSRWWRWLCCCWGAEPQPLCQIARGCSSNRQQQPAEQVVLLKTTLLLNLNLSRSSHSYFPYLTPLLIPPPPLLLYYSSTSFHSFLLRSVKSARRLRRSSPALSFKWMKAREQLTSLTSNLFLPLVQSQIEQGILTFIFIVCIQKIYNAIIVDNIMCKINCWWWY